MRKRASSLYFGKGDFEHEGADTETINDRCCRLYTRPGFEATWIWEGDRSFHDFCVDESAGAYDEIYFKLSDIPWINSV